jgi:hypothetical protein
MISQRLACLVFFAFIALATLSLVRQASVPVPVTLTSVQIPNGLDLVKQTRRESTAQPLRITVFSADLHIGLVEDLKFVFAQLPGIRVRWIDYSLSVYCHLTPDAACAPANFTSNVLSFSELLNAASSDDAAFGRFHRWATGFFATNGVNIVFCAHPTSTCRLYLPFLGSNMTLIVWQAVTLGSTGNEAMDLAPWFREYERIFHHPNALVMVNNQYHQAEVAYQLGLWPQYRRNLCLYARHAGGVYNASASASRSSVRRLVQIARHPQPHLTADTMNALFQAHLSDKSSSCINADLHFVDFEEHSAGFASYSAVTAIVYLPYATSLMSFFELFALNIPIFTPSLEYKIMLERVHAADLSWNWHVPPWRDRVRADELSWGWYVPPWRTVPTDIPSPIDASERARRHWLNKSDFVTLPHLQHFDNYRALCRQLCNADLDAISERMRVQNDMDLRAHSQFWASFLRTRFDSSP